MCYELRKTCEHKTDFLTRIYRHTAKDTRTNSVRCPLAKCRTSNKIWTPLRMARPSLLRCHSFIYVLHFSLDESFALSNAFLLFFFSFISIIKIYAKFKKYSAFEFFSFLFINFFFVIQVQGFKTNGGTSMVHANERWIISIKLKWQRRRKWRKKKQRWNGAKPLHASHKTICMLRLCSWGCHWCWCRIQILPQHQKYKNNEIWLVRTANTQLKQNLVFFSVIFMLLNKNWQTDSQKCIQSDGKGEIDHFCLELERNDTERHGKYSNDSHFWHLLSLIVN